MDSGIAPEKEWWTAAEIAEAKLPGLPGTVQNVNAFAERSGWRKVPGAIKRKPGRGGGWSYHWSVLPSAAREKLVMQEAAEPVPAERPDRAAAWVAYEKLSQKNKKEAARRLDALAKVGLLHSSGTVHVQAVGEIADEYKISPRTIYNWLGLIEGIPAADHLAYLAPQPPKKRTKTEDRSKFRMFMDWLKSAFLRMEGPTFAQSYRDAVRVASHRGWEFPILKTAKRWMDAEVPRTTQVYKREGPRGLMRCFPAQIRDRSSLHALEAVNADCHKFDVFVRWPDGKIRRPQMIAFQDLYSGKFLSWRVDCDPNKIMVMAAFGEMVDNWGIPKRCLFDNGHEFANKWMTGGSPTRFRFKVRDDDAHGVLTLLGINLTWAQPASGQSKPIERAFGGHANDIAKDVRFAGAYVGNRPDAKPENYGSHAVPLHEFVAVLEERIEEHNARTGRRTDTAAGRSFDETFAESYATANILRATEEQRNLWLMGQETGKLHKNNGSLKFLGNVYHCDWMSQEAGRNIVIRFDPEDLHSGVHIYTPHGAHLGFAECQQKIGFFSHEDARVTAKRKRDIVKKEKELAKLYAPHTPAQLGADLNGTRKETTALVEAKVVKPVFAKPSPRHAAPAKRAKEADRARDALVVSFKAKAQNPAPAEAGFKPAETAQARFEQALEIEHRAQAGKPVGKAELDWLSRFQNHHEYRARLAMHQLNQNNTG
ncbi:Mu transposase C-terminal domain-containing protein [Leisingera sp. M527]|uniref:transposase domain-containing protein n=1 Tax=Leisingera sp. M527 TaxID=2867014 RepID=UPI0021A6F039|nr:transposase domain-containing protein [Leisingera sp. M527]UWQ34597.1 Mu transposase C-terminal domain-containing protein [Leisingera sp. M527]